MRGSNGNNSASPTPIEGEEGENTITHYHGDTGLGEEEDDDDLPHNPPTPGRLDISLRAMSPFSRRAELEVREEQQRQSSQQSDDSSLPPTSLTPPYHLSTTIPTIRQPGDVSPPSYQLIDSNQYPAGVAEAMLEAMPEEQFNALFAQAAASHHSNNMQSNQINTSNTRWSILRPQAIPGASHSNDQIPPSSSSSSVLLHNYENRSTQPGDVENQYSGHEDGNEPGAGLGLGLGRLFGSIWGAAASGSSQQQP